MGMIRRLAVLLCALVALSCAVPFGPALAGIAPDAQARTVVCPPAPVTGQPTQAEAQGAAACLSAAIEAGDAPLFEALLEAYTPSLRAAPEVAAVAARGYLALGRAEACLEALARSGQTRFALLLLEGYCRLNKGEGLRASLVARRAVDFAGSLEEVRKARDLYREAVSRRVFDLRLSLQVYPTTNENRATTTEQVSLFGLPFQLNETRQGGIRVSTSAEATLRPRLSLFVRRRVFPFLTAAVGFDNNLFGQTFTQVRLRPGAVLGLTDRQDIILFALAGRSYLSHDIVINETGGGATWRYRRQGQTTELSYSLLRQDYPALGAQATQHRVLAANRHQGTYDELGYSLGLEETGSRSFLLDRVSVLGTLTYKRVLLRHIIAQGSGALSYSRFRRDDPLFGQRRDLNSTVEGRLTSATVSFFGLSPSLFLRHIRQDSSIPVYETRASEVGVDLQFLL